MLGLREADHEEYGSSSDCLFVSQLACSLVGQTQTIHLEEGSRVRRICGASELRAEYFCNYGLNPGFRSALERGDLAITGVGAEGDVRVVELPQHPFYLATLFLPQWDSEPGRPDPIVVAFLEAARASR